MNVVSPGWIDARDLHEREADPLGEADHYQHPAGRVGTVEDVASAVSWLIGDNSGFVTGQEFIIDGGMTRKMVYLD
ncbi:2-(S)-hydroxypropyl-CoM dehydrogenase [compost metagenome]